jgi:hypothetical protein
MDADIFKGGKFYDDDGNELDSDLYQRPALCLSCVKIIPFPPGTVLLSQPVNVFLLE